MRRHVIEVTFKSVISESPFFVGIVFFLWQGSEGKFFEPNKLYDDLLS